MLKLPNVKAVFDRKKKSSAVTTGKVEIEITFSRTQRKILSSGVELYANQWEDGLVVRHANAKQLNKKITDLIKNYKGIIRTIAQDGEDEDAGEEDLNHDGADHRDAGGGKSCLCYSPVLFPKPEDRGIW